MNKRRVTLAFDNATGTNVLIRQMSDEAQDDALEPDLGPEALNELLLAKNSLDLISTAERIGPIYGQRRSACNGMAPWGTAAISRLSPPTDDALATECYFDPYAAPADPDDSLVFTESGKGGIAAARRACDAYGAEQDDLDSLSERAEEHPLTVERVQDWVLLRNLLSICMRLGAMARDGIQADLMEEAGFSHTRWSTFHGKIALDGPSFVIPVAFNTFYGPASPLGAALRPERMEEPTYPLLARICEQVSRYRLTYVDQLHGEPSVKFVSATQAEMAKGTFRRRDVPAHQRWLYLAVEDKPGESQTDAALRLVNGLDRALYRPEIRFSQAPIDEIEVLPNDLPCACWALFRSHPGFYLVTCENCHRTVLAPSQGKRRRFCSDACRATWNKERRGRQTG